MSTLIFDVETIGENFDELDKTTQEALSNWIKKEADTKEEYQVLLEELKAGLGFSPLTGEIVVLGVLDLEKDKGVVYFQAPNEKIKDFNENSYTFKQRTEKEMLADFWQGSKEYTEFVSFNGRAFDVPFILIRSAVWGVKPSKDLMSNRYLSSQKFEAKHIDLLDQLTFYGVIRRKGNLHLWSRVFGIKSPKTAGITGEEVGELFKQGRYLDIARYNVGDLRATRELYLKWCNYLSF